MNTFFSSISNREYATIIIVGIFLLYCLIKSSEARKSLIQLIKLFFYSKLLFLYLIPILYLSLVTGILYHNHLWDFSLLKDTIITVLFALCLFGASISADDFIKMYKEHLYSYISLIYLLEFVVGIYDFNIFIEILLVSFSTLLGMLAVHMKYDKTATSETKNFLNNILSFLGLFIILHTLVWIFKAPEKIFCLHSLQVLLLPFLYSLCLFPICYVVWIYSKYQSTLISIFVVRDNLKQHVSNREMIIKTIKLCKISIERLNLWQHFFLSNFGGSDDTLDIDNLIKEFKYRYKYIEPEANTNEIALNDTLSCMKKLGFPKSLYKYSGYSEGYGNYQALAYNKENTNRYYCVSGNQQYPQSFQLYDFIFNSQNIKLELKIFSDYCIFLYYKIFSQKLKKKYISKILHLKRFSLKNEPFKIEFITNKNIDGKIMDVTFKISKIIPVELCSYELNYTQHRKVTG